MVLYRSYTSFFISICCVVWLACTLPSCTTVKNYPANKPFVFDNKIVIKGKIANDEKKRITVELNNYWDDSIRARKVQQFVFAYKLQNPPAFDTLTISTSKLFMNAYLNSQGYYYASLQPSYHIDTVKKQFRTTVSMTIDIGKSIKIDSVWYNLTDTTLQKLAITQQKNSYLQKGTVYTKQLVSSELDRLINIFHQNGYYKLQREDLFAYIDTLDNQLLQLSLDPFEQAKLISKVAKDKKADPKWNIGIMQRTVKDTLKLTQFYIGNLYYYPEYNGLINADTLIRSNALKTFTYKELIMKYKDGKFNYKPLREHTYLRIGNLYNEDLLYKSVNTLGRMGAWTSADYLLKPRNKDTLDIHFFLTPTLKQSYTASLEGSRNTGDIGSGNLLGIATNFNYTNRNVWKKVIQSATNLRLGVEFNLDQQQSNNTYSFLQTVQASLGQSYSFPKIITPFSTYLDRKLHLNRLENKRTILSATGAYTDRRRYYQLRSLVTNWGYEWSKGNNGWLFKPLNIELYKVDTLAGLIELFRENPFLRNSFRNGNVVGSSLSWSRTFSNKKDPSQSHLLRLGEEESGALLGLFSQLSDKIFTYVKLEAEYRYLKKYPKNELATRFMIGAGVPKAGQTLPVFKQYFLGGPNSMRAWGLRQLGLGSSKILDTATSGYTDRFGDFMMEANIEYRFQLANFSAVKVSSAIYSDIGNVWNIHKEAGNPNSTIAIRDLGKDLAIGLGTGLRLDFSYFLFRLDFAYKLKDPARLQNGGWVNPTNFEWTNTRENGTRVKNYAFQFGIGLPF